MSKEIYISSTPHETRLAIVETDELTEIYYERENEYTLAGSIYNGRVTRVLPGMQSSFVDIGLERDAFLYITDFMEEAADTAEFDHTGDAPRPARSEGQRSDRNGERNGGGRDYGRGQELGSERPSGYVSERSREQASATPTSDAVKASDGRTEEFGGRGDRSGRGRGRGRRDRGGNRPASGERTPFGEESSRTGQADEPREFEADERPVVAAELTVDPETPTVDEAELGEAAPGADGSRRWRGRRGRRRGRGTGPREEGAGLAGQEIESAPTADEFEEGTTFEIDGGGAPEMPVVPTPVEPSETSQERTRRREGREGREDRGGRGDRNARGLRVPRGFAPRSSLYAVDAASEPEPVADQPIELAAAASEPEPLILPGESLSKYRKGDEPAGKEVAVSPGMATPIALPDSGFKVDPNWDGGAMLPGETLSRYRGGSAPASASQGRTESRSDFRRPDGRRDERDGRGGRDERGSSRRDGSGRGGQQREDSGRRFQREGESAGLTVPASVPARDLQSSGPVSGYAHVDGQTEKIAAQRPDFAHSELPAATAEAPRMEDSGLARQIGKEHPGAVEEIALPEPAAAVEPEQEYEPEGQSVSYRVDPVAPSEYRQASVAAILPEEIPGEASEEVYESAWPEAASEGAARLSELPEGLHAMPFTGVASVAAEALPEQPAFAHDVTMVDAMGEMHSEAHHAPAIQETESVQGFAPGAGDLEEDFIEEDEVDSISLHAQSDEEYDELEEEHLEGAADLGTMIRDMTVDQITRADGATLQEEEDFEEDTLEEDGEEAAEESFAAPEESGFGFREEEESPRSMQDGHSGVVEQPGFGNRGEERRGRDSGRDNGRRGGRDRDRTSGNRVSRGDRNGSSETSGYGDRSSSDRGSSERSYPDRSGLGERARNTGGASDRDRGRSGGRGGRQSMQMTNLPAISDLLKPGQEILVQIAKEPIAKKGARITSHIALPGRFLVFMPTVSHTGVSRKIESDGERRRLKEILLSEKGEAAGGFIVRTAAAGASEEELRSDLRFLLNLWADIKQRSESSKSPALIYHDLNLVERILRDQVTDNFSAIWVDTETEYERVLRFLQRFQPGLIRRVKLYTKETPLFEQFGITEEINKALRSKVWLKSGGSIVINQTEALVAIDINTGKYVGKTARLEDTIVKTNLDAIPEIVRQIRLRDLGGIIIIDFIDMDERKNRNRVMQALEDELKNDRAPSKVLPFNDFGLVAITRKRVKQSLERTLSTTCVTCTGTGMVKSPVTVCNDIYVEMRKMHKHLDRGDVMLRVHPEVVKQLKSTGTKWLQEMEEMCGKTILIKSDPSLHPEQFDIH